MTYKHWSNVAGPGDMTFVTTTAEGFRPVREPGGELLASFESGGSARYYHFDALGSTVLLSDSSGNPTSAYAYGAWGDVLASPASWQPYQYVGQLGYYTHTTSQGTELADWLQLGVRFYQPGLGRFERRDPALGFPDHPAVTHTASYVYVVGRPTADTDPTGLLPGFRYVPLPAPRFMPDSGCGQLAARWLSCGSTVMFNAQDVINCLSCCIELESYISRFIPAARASKWSTACGTACESGVPYFPWQHLPQRKVWRWW